MRKYGWTYVKPPMTPKISGILQRPPLEIPGHRYGIPGIPSGSPRRTGSLTRIPCFPPGMPQDSDTINNQPSLIDDRSSIIDDHPSSIIDHRSPIIVTSWKLSKRLTTLRKIKVGFTRISRRRSRSCSW